MYKESSYFLPFSQSISKINYEEEFKNGSEFVLIPITEKDGAFLSWNVLLIDKFTKIYKLGNINLSF